MDTSTITTIIVTTAVLGWILTRQLARRSVRERSVVWIVLALVGVVQTVDFLGTTTITVADVALLSGSLLLGVALAVLRAMTVRLTRSEDGGIMQQGTWVTILLWVVGIGQHLLIDHLVLEGFGTASLLLYLGIVIGVAREIVIVRARRFDVAGRDNRPGQDRTVAHDRSTGNTAGAVDVS